MDLVVLVVDLGLYSTVADLKTTKENEIFGCLESLPALSDFIQKLVPSINLFSQLFVYDVLLLVDVPE